MTTPASTFDLDAANKTIGNAMLGLIKLMLPVPGQEPPTPEHGQELMKQITDAMATGSRACSEVNRLREEFAHLRDRHRPQPTTDPTKPGVICSACSIHGALIPWPCDPWTTAENSLSHGQS
ncbi:hypothetical protein ACIRVF_07895 [Kitasatospora sp. NPDC101157]|uniref:hypothetical protein n=1 Tax=Kitasatospora sp. NPDC101157 TaxID=3364098 RepID=UPI003829CF7C